MFWTRLLRPDENIYRGCKITPGENLPRTPENMMNPCTLDEAEGHAGDTLLHMFIC